ncbi:50S ribosomal protein L11 methyltransferase [Sphingomonas alba]|uniref:50S ribosomal protein L11 methyltransferase n=1 Tax=Sphingomonas alba TaxID=2908208 RepID=A0ABT0RJK7_9SPHN|nr:50S ribosomal protein L11 methyltransferase [Sphingomonas alba]MCL6682821.1 50S ribosomal protein L11 methyltransferase [Sphingomonas alba]
MSAYADALRKAVTPGCTVFDIGAGQGIFSILACKYGAGAVVAIDPDDTIALARELAANNGCADRITFFQGLSTDFQPSVRADVIVSDIRGGLPLFEHHIPSIVDARERLLRRGGTLIPMRDTIRIALAENTKAYELHERPWLENKFDIDLTAGHRFACNVRTKAEMAPADLLSELQDLLTIDYRHVTDTDATAFATLSATRSGTAHGMNLSFQSELAEGISFSTEPGVPENVYGQNFFPFQRPVELAAGDHVDVEISARLVDGSYIWNWNSEFRRQGQSGAPLKFRQSSFLGKIYSPQSLARQSRQFIPPASEAQQIDQLCLSLVDGKRSLEAIAGELNAKFPNRFTSASDALNHVANLTARYR